MSLVNLDIKRFYDSSLDNILDEFYIPALRESVHYKRLVGFFTSNSLALAASGIIGLIKNRGKIQLLTSPVFTRSDIEAINDASKLDEHISGILLEEIELISEDFIMDHVKALGWLIKNGLLELKIALVMDNNGSYLDKDEVNNYGIFHQKVGILRDMQDNILTFSGSNNETANAWQNNIEEFKVFRSWENVEKDYVENDLIKFDNLWGGKSDRIKILDLPEAVHKKLVSLSPDYKKLMKSLEPEKRINFFSYQEEAIANWIENSCCGVFEMATGTGKTYTSLGCLYKLNILKGATPTIISAPYNHLLSQWVNEIKKFGLTGYTFLTCDGNNMNWKEELFDLIADAIIYNNKRIVVLTTHNTLSSQSFIKIIKSFDLEYFLVADEAHGLGARVTRNGLLRNYKYRLALSATPNRWYDKEGSSILLEYFKGIVYTFSLCEAITKINPLTKKTYLTPFNYKLDFVKLSIEELEEYINLSKSITRLNSDDDLNDLVDMLKFKRSNIIKNASHKFELLHEILDQIGDDNISHTIIYITPQQINDVIEILSNRGIVFNKITMKESSKPSRKFNGLSERDFILQNFSNGNFKVLIAMKCLDEGVDIPQAKNAILLASSGNPREYIQRIGRVIRRWKNKTEANIYDFLCTPDLNSFDAQLAKFERKIFDLECKRALEIAKCSRNNAEVIEQISRIKDISYGII